jgi:16S rRNA (guanine966-N2)-methyltransferase
MLSPAIPRRSVRAVVRLASGAKFMAQFPPEPRSVARAAPGKLRIIGGSLRGSKLAVPGCAELRPTPDRVRETLFNWLAGAIDGARCLDLYAGTGALGIEALSRGAGSCSFVERDRGLAGAISANLARLKVDGGRVECVDAMEFLDGAPTTFDVVFLDPPFHAGLWEQAALALEVRGWLADAAHIYVERPDETAAIVMPANWLAHRESRAGGVRFSLYRRSRRDPLS